MKIEEIIYNQHSIIIDKEKRISINVEETANAIRKELLESLPKNWEHSEGCLYVIEPRYFGNPSKEKYCDCGACDTNQCLNDVRKIIKGEEDE